MHFFCADNDPILTRIAADQAAWQFPNRFLAFARQLGFQNKKTGDRPSQFAIELFQMVSFGCRTV